MSAPAPPQGAARSRAQLVAVTAAAVAASTALYYAVYSYRRAQRAPEDVDTHAPPCRKEDVTADASSGNSSSPRITHDAFLSHYKMEAASVRAPHTHGRIAAQRGFHPCRY